MRILGISALYHDSAAAVVVDGRVVAAAQEERFSRKKHDARFPVNAVLYCLAEAGCQLSELDSVVFYDKPFLKFERLLETYLTFAPRGFSSFRIALPVWLKEKLFQRELLARELKTIDPDFSSQHLLFTEHHLSHAASAFFPSPFNEAAVLTMHVARNRHRKPAQHLQGDPLPPLARVALFGLHILHRLQGQLRRVQIDGTRPLWRA